MSGTHRTRPAPRRASGSVRARPPWRRYRSPPRRGPSRAPTAGCSVFAGGTSSLPAGHRSETTSLEECRDLVVDDLDPLRLGDLRHRFGGEPPIEIGASHPIFASDLHGDELAGSD